MLHISSVFGEWMVTKTSWKFRVIKEKGGKLFTIKDGLKFDDMVQMVNEDFGIDRLIHEVQLSYVLPKSMMRNMPKDSPPVFVTSDRQLDIFCEICISVPLHLYISVKNSNIENQDLVLGFREISGEGGESMTTGKSTDNVDIHDNNDEAEVGIASFQDGNVLQEGQCFKSKTDLSWKIRMLAIEHKFRIIVYKSDTKLLVVKCVDKNCKWKVRASKENGSCKYFWVTKYIDKHTCLSRNIGPPKASSKLMCKLLLENFGSAGLSMKPDLISTTLKKRYGIDSKYWKTWKSRENAREEVLGSPESSYAQLPVYIHKIQKANPESIVCLEIDDQKRFKYLFFSFAASAKGYEFMRKVVVVDGTFLKEKYGGILLVATAQDGDSHIYPLAFGIVDSENDAAWEWFFMKLRSVVSDGPRLVMISDRHLSIGTAIEKVYPLAHRGICTYHLEKNCISKAGGKKVVRMVRTASRAYTTEEFNAIFSEIRRQNQKLGVYLQEANVQLWSRAYFPGDKYDIITSNSAESLNSLFRKPRELPIVPLIEAIRNTLTRWFFDRRESAAKLSTSLTPRVEKELQKRCHLSYTFDVQPINEHEFQIFDGSNIYLVDLQQMTCTCRVFDIEKIPCTHAAKAAMSRGIDPGLLVHKYYTKSHLCAAYSESIRPIDEFSDLSEIPSAIVGQICLPPDVQRQPGRPKKRRFEGFGEQIMRKKARQTCSRCRRSGHNRATCDFGF